MEIQCTFCQKRLRLPDNAAGKKFKCPSCQHILTASNAPVSSPPPTSIPPPLTTTKLGTTEKPPEPHRNTASMLSLNEPKSTVLDLPPDIQEAPLSPSEPPSAPTQSNRGTSSIAPEQARNLLRVLQSCKYDMERAMRDRDEAMEMVDTFFQQFMERANNPRVKLEEREEFRDIAQKIFQLQQRFPILSSVKDALTQCENLLHQFE